MRTLRVKRQLQPVYRNHHPLVPEGLMLVVHKRREILLPLNNKATATPRTSTYLKCTCRRRRKSAVPNVATKKRHTPRPLCTALHRTLQMSKTAQSTKCLPLVSWRQQTTSHRVYTGLKRTFLVLGHSSADALCCETYFSLS